MVSVHDVTLILGNYVKYRKKVVYMLPPPQALSRANLRAVIFCGQKFRNVNERGRACHITCRNSGICVENRESKKIALKFRPSLVQINFSRKVG